MLILPGIQASTKNYEKRQLALTRAYVSEVYSFINIRKYQKLTSVYSLGQNSAIARFV